MTIEEFIERAIRVPFKDKGRDWSGWDCYGSVYCAFREVKGIILPEYLDYLSTREYAQLKTLIDSVRPTWEEVTNPQVMDVAVFTLSQSPCHVALMIDARNALHAEKKLGTFIEPIDSAVWKKRLEGIYRCKTL